MIVSFLFHLSPLAQILDTPKYSNQFSNQLSMLSDRMYSSSYVKVLPEINFSIWFSEYHFIESHFILNAFNYFAGFYFSDHNEMLNCSIPNQFFDPYFSTLTVSILINSYYHLHETMYAYASSLSSGTHIQLLS